MRVLVLGGGVQGRVVARNLASRPTTDEVLLGDVHPPRARLPAGVVPLRVDATKAAAVARAARGCDVAVTAVPGAIGHRALRHLVAAGVPTVDLAFMPEAPFDLDGEARRAGVPVVVDCGVAPGTSHVLAAALRRELGGLDEVRIYVGGVPLRPPPLFRHAVYFHAPDLLSEYVRPARMRAKGRARAPAPMDHPTEALRDPEAGPLEAFLSDGLRSLLRSMPDVPDMSEWTLRVPGHMEFMRMLHALGFLDGGEATARAARVLGERYDGAAFPDRLLLEVWGRRGSRTRKVRLHDVRTRGESAMARTTAYAAAAAASLLGGRVFEKPGVHAPETLGDDGRTARAFLADLARSGLTVEWRGRLRPSSPGSPPRRGSRAGRAGTGGTPGRPRR